MAALANGAGTGKYVNKIRKTKALAAGMI